MEITFEMVKNAIKECWIDFYNYETDEETSINSILLKIEELYKNTDDLTSEEENQVQKILDEEIKNGTIKFRIKNIYYLLE